MVMCDIAELRRVKTFRHLDVGRPQAEVALLEQGVRTAPQQLRSFSPHKVQVDGREYWAYDAKALNRQVHQSGRGMYRYLLHQGTYAGVAMHTPSGDYRKVA